MFFCTNSHFIAVIYVCVMTDCFDMPGSLFIDKGDSVFITHGFFYVLFFITGYVYIHNIYNTNAICMNLRGILFLKNI